MQSPNKALRWFTFISILVNVVMSTVMERLDLWGESMGVITRRYDSLFVPAGYAFSIWGLIYAAFIIYGIIQLLPAQKSKPIYDHLAVPVILINLGGLCWQIVFRSNLLLPSIGIILVMLVAGMLLFLRTYQGIWAQHRSKWLMVPSSLFLGWISVATIANIALWLSSTQWEAANLSDATWTKVLLIITILLGVFISLRYRDFIYPAVIAWASYAIFVALQNREESVAQVAMYVAIISVLLTVIAAARNTNRQLNQNSPTPLS